MGNVNPNVPSSWLVEFVGFDEDGSMMIAVEDGAIDDRDDDLRGERVAEAINRRLGHGRGKI